MASRAGAAGYASWAVQRVVRRPVTLTVNCRAKALLPNVTVITLELIVTGIQVRKLIIFTALKIVTWQKKKVSIVGGVKMEL